MPIAELDTAPLTDAASPAAVRAYRRGRGEVSGPPVRVRPCLGGLSYTTATIVAGIGTALVASLGADLRVLALGVAATAAAALGAFLCARSTSARTCRREYRLASVARRNGLVYERGAEQPTLPGLGFSSGRGRALRRFTGVVGGRSVEAGNYRHDDGDISGYIIVGDRAEIVEPIDFADPAEWQRVWQHFSRAA